MGLQGLPAPVRGLLLSQMLFNIGFYLVVPFIAVQMTDSFGAGGALVGLVMGIRTFSQQGFFFLEGGLADRFGIRPVLPIGVAVRITGFLVVGPAHSVSWKQLLLPRVNGCSGLARTLGPDFCS